MTQVSAVRPVPLAGSAAGPPSVKVSEAQLARVMATYQAVQDWDLGVVARYAVQEGSYKADEIDAVLDEYARFIALATTFGREWVPISAFLDEFWHTHILFTEDYVAMCQTVVGRFVHHRPRILDDETQLKERFTDRTLDLYRQCFGEPNKTVWNCQLCRCGPCD